MTTPQDPFAAAGAFLSGGNVAAKFPQVGFVVEGVVKSAKMAQQTDYDDGTPLTWGDGSPRMQLIVEIQSEATGQTWKGIRSTPTPVPNDDGMRTLYVKGNMQKAFSKALTQAQAKFENGGHLRIERIADGVAKGKNEPPHDFHIVWTPPSVEAAATDFLSKPAAAPAGGDEPPF